MFGAQHQHPEAAHSEKPVALYPGLGTWTHPISTRSPEAQKYFDQGLTLMYAFNRYEAVRSFRKTLELDPGAAMAHWGIAMALGPYLNMDFDPEVDVKQSCQAVIRGLAMKEATGTERVWLEAANARCPNYSEPQKYSTAMRALAARFPDDPDAQTLFAESLILPVRWRHYTSGGKPAEGVDEALGIIEGVLRRHPNHPGANHFYIHILESSPTPERAIPSAQRLMGIVPAAGHMVHMPGHIWLVLGEYDAVVAVNERAAQIDREYFAKTGVRNSTYQMMYLHNLAFILHARAMQGRVAETRKAIAAFREAAAPLAQAMPEMTTSIEAYVSRIELRMRMWDEVLTAARPETRNTHVTVMWHYARALAFSGKAAIREARQERERFEEVRKQIDRDMHWGTNKLGDVIDLAAGVLDARLEPDLATAVAKWRRVVEIQDGLTYFEPPAWYYPVRESLGAALLRSGDASSAEKVFREGLRQSPNNGRLLFGLRERLRAQDKIDATVWVEREFRKAWKDADLTLRVDDL